MAAHQAPHPAPSLGFSRQEYWSHLSEAPWEVSSGPRQKSGVRRTWQPPAPPAHPVLLISLARHKDRRARGTCPWPAAQWLAPRSAKTSARERLRSRAPGRNCTDVHAAAPDAGAGEKAYEGGVHSLSEAGEEGSILRVLGQQTIPSHKRPGHAWTFSLKQR